MKMLGLVGGTSWVSTIDYYRLLNELVNERLGGSQYAQCIIYSFNYGEILALNAAQDWDGILEKVVGAGACLREGGAEGLEAWRCWAPATPWRWTSSKDRLARHQIQTTIPADPDRE